MTCDGQHPCCTEREKPVVQRCLKEPVRHRRSQNSSSVVVLLRREGRGGRYPARSEQNIDPSRIELASHCSVPGHGSIKSNIFFPNLTTLTYLPHLLPSCVSSIRPVDDVCSPPNCLNPSSLSSRHHDQQVSPIRFGAAVMDMNGFIGLVAASLAAIGSDHTRPC